MDRADEYVKQALDAEAAAEWASDPDIKRQFREIAEQWRALAERARWPWGRQPD